MLVRNITCPVDHENCAPSGQATIIDQYFSLTANFSRTHGRYPLSSEHLSAIESMMQQMARSVIGQEEVVRTLTLALLCNGNVLLEGLPGTAKTRSIKTLVEGPDCEAGPHPVHP